MFITFYYSILTMFRFNENYYLRKCFFEREQIPTQSEMIKRMSPPLAKIYFKSMTAKLKVLAGLEPPMKGGGSDWYIPPKDILQDGRVVLKPIKKEYLSKLGFMGIGFIGEKLVEDLHRRMEDEKNRVLLENDINWKKTIEVSCRQQWDDSSKGAAKKNTEKIQHAFQEFTTLYMTSIEKVELLLFDVATKEIKRVKELACKHMNDRYETFLKQQATILYDIYQEKLMMEKARLKAQFIENVECSRTAMADQLHDINVDKHVAVEKLRQLLECQNLACQVYVALKERDECEKEMTLSKHEHKKKVKALTQQIALKDFEIRLAKEKESKRMEFNRIWQEKVCHVVKKFQKFVDYCLNTLPDHAEFFINMEKLMMLQLNEAMEQPHIESIFEPEGDQFHTPVPKPHPFYLFCDKGYRPQLDQNLCPKHCTSSASQLPVIVINKRCIYASCDTFEMFTNKMKEFIYGRRGDDVDFEDDHDYTYDIPVKYTSSQHLLELKLENSLMQVLQIELPNVKEVPIECCVCRIPYCFCSPLHASKMSLNIVRDIQEKPLESISSGNKVETRSVELQHEREPKWESYMKYVEPRKCKCAKTAKKHLQENVPAYMINMSTFDIPELPTYEMCSLKTLKKLVKKARGKHSPPPEQAKVESKTYDEGTQYSNQEFDYLCTCFSDNEVERLFIDLAEGSNLDEQGKAGQFKVVDGDVSLSFMSKNTSSFATHRAYSLRHLIESSPELEEIFRKKNCTF